MTMAVILVPSLHPDDRLVSLVAALRDDDRAVVVVDDGSGNDYRATFTHVERLGAVVVTHPENRGKGAALRSGLREIMREFPGEGVVTADGDGQHTPADIAHVADLLDAQERPTLILGTRSFGAAPLRSRVGNTVTRAVFLGATRQRITDTQTGLRAIPATLLPWSLSIPGDRFEYEFRVLLRAAAARTPVHEVPITTVYLDGNASSHFRPVRDSLRIYAPLLRFGASALTSFLLDTVLLLVVYALTGWLLGAVVVARVISAAVNFALNRSLVFARARDVPLRTAAMRYLSLALLVLAASFGVITALTDLGVPLLPAKLGTEAALFLVSYSVQRSVVFVPGTSAQDGPATAAQLPRADRDRHDLRRRGVAV